MGKHVLLISYVSLMANMPNGRTMQSLLHGVDPDDIYLVYSYGKPDQGSCKSAYCLNNYDVLKSVYSFHSAGYTYIPESEEKKQNVKVAETEQQKVEKNSKNYYLRDICWSFGKWKRKLLKWCKEQQIDYIVYMYGDNPAYQKMALYLKEKLNVPLILYTCEDYYFKDYNYIDGNDSSFFFRRYHHKSRRMTQKLMRNVSALIANTDLLARTYQDEFKIGYTKTITMASKMDFHENWQIADPEQITVSYLGAIAEYRRDAFLDIANALEEIDGRIVFEIYGRIDDPSILKSFEECRNIRYCGFVSYETVKEVMHKTNLLVDAINISTYSSKDNRFGFSTKYADCLACGTPLLVYAPEEIVEMQFALENKCAFTARSKDELVPVLKDALFSAQKRKEQIEKAKDITALYFNEENNIKKYSDTISYAMNG